MRLVGRWVADLCRGNAAATVSVQDPEDVSSNFRAGRRQTLSKAPRSCAKPQWSRVLVDRRSRAPGYIMDGGETTKCAVNWGIDYREPHKAITTFPLASYGHDPQAPSN